MPPPSSNPAFALTLLPRLFKVAQRPLNVGLDAADIALLRDDHNRAFVSITRTDEEISIVYECEAHEEGTWRCIKIAGPMDFGITGVMCDFTIPLKQAGVPIFAVSTWNTDYILVPASKATEAVTALTQDGWTFAD